MRSRDGANLKYTSNDTKGIYIWSCKPHLLPNKAFIYVEDPKKVAVEEAIEQINKVRSNYPLEKAGSILLIA